MAPARGPVFGILCILGAALIWSTGGLVARELSSLGAWTTVFWRSLTALIFLVLFGMATERGGLFVGIARMGWPGLIIACCYTVASIAFVVAVQLTSVAEVLILMSCAPLLAALFARIVLGEKLTGLGWAALVLSIAGAAVMVSGSYERGNLLGNLVAASIALAVAISIVTFRRHREVSLVPGMCVAMVFALVISSVVAMPAAFPPVREAALVTLFGAGNLGLGLALFALGAPRIPAALTAILGVLEPVLGPVWVWLVLGEAPAGPALIGGAIVIAALLLFIVAGMVRRV